MIQQKGIKEIEKQVDGEFTQIQLVENIHTADQEYKTWGARRKKFREMLATTLIEAGVTEATVGEEVVTISPKTQNTFDLTDLGALDKITTEDQVRKVVKQVPSSKQLNALADLGGAAVASVVKGARRKIETDTIVVRIMKPKKIKAGRRGRS